MKKLLQFKLKIWAKLVLRKYKPKVIGITGSVGKTGTKEAIATVLKTKYNVRASSKNYNNEFGVSLTVLGVDSPGRNPFGWIAVGLRAWRLVLWRDKSYPEILVLELGIDRPGDMKRHLKVVKPTIGVVTAIDAVHVEHFQGQSDLAREKAWLVENLPSDGYALLNRDDGTVYDMKKLTPARVMTYGFDKQADIRADHVRLSFRGDTEHVDQLQGASFKVSYQGATVPVLLPDNLGVGPLYAALAAIAIGTLHGINLVEIGAALRDFRTPPGRMHLLDGIKHTKVLDDTYNAAPRSTTAAVEVLAQIPLAGSHRRYAVLGDMLELGAQSVAAHRAVGKLVHERNVDVLITVGERARDIARGAKKAGMSEDRVFMFPTAAEAQTFVQRRIKAGDLILVKGSQGMRMERIVKEIMAEPQRAASLLVRQEPRWLKK